MEPNGSFSIDLRRGVCQALRVSASEAKWGQMMQDDQLHVELANERDVKEVFNEALQLVAAGEPLREEHYLQLTHIAGDKMGSFKLIWDGFGTAERQSILKRLKEHEENDLRMEFNEVYTTSPCRTKIQSSD